MAQFRKRQAEQQRVYEQNVHQPQPSVERNASAQCAFNPGDIASAIRPFGEFGRAALIRAPSSSSPASGTSINRTNGSPYPA